MSTTTKTKTTLAVVTAVTLVITAAMVLALSTIITIQEVNAQGPPPKAQLILSTPPSERGTVASGDHGRPCSGC